MTTRIPTSILTAALLIAVYGVVSAQESDALLIGFYSISPDGTIELHEAKTFEEWDSLIPWNNIPQQIDEQKPAVQGWVNVQLQKEPTVEAGRDVKLLEGGFHLFSGNIFGGAKYRKEIQFLVAAAKMNYEMLHFLIQSAQSDGSTALEDVRSMVEAFSDEWSEFLE